MAISVIVILGYTASIDQEIISTIKKLHEDGVANLLMVRLSFLGDTSSLLFLAIVLAIIRRTRRVGMILLCSTLIIIILSMYIKIIIGREMPPSFSATFNNDSLNQNVEEEPVSTSARNLSYPSIHMAIAACFAYLVRVRLKPKHRVPSSLIWLYPILVGASRLYVLQYYVTDLAGGFLMGLIIGISMNNMLRVNALPTK